MSLLLAAICFAFWSWWSKTWYLGNRLTHWCIEVVCVKPTKAQFTNIDAIYYLFIEGKNKKRLLTAVRALNLWWMVVLVREYLIYSIYSFRVPSAELPIQCVYFVPGESRKQTMISGPIVCCFSNNEYNYNFIMAAMSVSRCVKLNRNFPTIFFSLFFARTNQNKPIFLPHSVFIRLLIIIIIRW